MLPALDAEREGATAADGSTRTARGPKTASDFARRANRPPGCTLPVRLHLPALQGRNGLPPPSADHDGHNHQHHESGNRSTLPRV